MTTHEVFSINFHVSDNVEQLTAHLQKARAVAAGLTKQMSHMGVTAGASMKTIRNDFRNSMVQSGYFKNSTVDMVHATEKFNASLAAQKLSLRESWRAMAGYRKEQGMLYKAAKENVRVMQSVGVLFNQGGKYTAEMFTGPAAQISSMNQRLLLSQQRILAFNAAVRNSSTQLTNWGKNTQWAGRQMMVGLTLPIGMFAVAAAAAFKKADEELVRITKVYGDTLSGKQVDKNQVRQDAMALAKDIASIYGVAFEETLSLTADIAAVGYTGKNLENAVKETTRLAVLGEVDRQQAMKTTLSLQTAFKKNNEELTESINFINAAENATSTSLQDMTEAIPRAGTVVKSLGGDVEDLTLYITAMREGGIGAAEAANALKSGLASIITPSKEAKNYVMALGVDMDKAINQGGGDLTKTLMLFKEQLDSLTEFQKAQVMSKLFGKHQMGRLMALFNNLGDKGSQTITIMKLMGYTAEELAGQAEQEIKTMQDSVSNTFARNWQRFRVEMAQLGEDLLKGVNVILKPLVSFVEWFNNLGDVGKQIAKWVGAAVAAFGPLVMIFGIFGNFAGYLQRIVGGLISMGMALKHNATVAAALKKNLATDGSLRISRGQIYEQATPESVAAKMFAEQLEKGSEDATRAMNTLRNSVQNLRMALQGLFDKQMADVGLRILGTKSYPNLDTITPLQLDKNAPRNPAVSLDSADLNNVMGNRSPVAFHMQAMQRAISGDIASERAMIQKATSDTLAGMIATERSDLLDKYNAMQAKFDSNPTYNMSTAGLNSTTLAALKQIQGVSVSSVKGTWSATSSGAINEIAKLQGVTEEQKRLVVQLLQKAFSTLAEEAAPTLQAEIQQLGQEIEKNLQQAFNNIKAMPVDTPEQQLAQKKAMEQFLYEQMYMPSVAIQNAGQKFQGGGQAGIAFQMLMADAWKTTQNVDAKNIFENMYGLQRDAQGKVAGVNIAEMRGAFQQAHSIPVGYAEPVRAAQAQITSDSKQHFDLRANQEAAKAEAINQYIAAITALTEQAKGSQVSAEKLEQAYNQNAEVLKQAQVSLIDQDETIEAYQQRLRDAAAAHQQEAAAALNNLDAITDIEKSQAEIASISETNAANNVDANKTKELAESKKKASVQMRRIGSGAGMLLSSMTMLTGVMGDTGKTLGQIGMGASMGMMMGPWGALAGAGAGLGLAIFQNLKQQSDNAANALKMGSLSAEIFGNKLKSIDDVNTSNLIESMTKNEKASNRVADAMNKFSEALQNAPEGSPEKAFVNRLQDLSGGNTGWETFIGNIAGSVMTTTFGGMPMVGVQKWLQSNNPEDVNQNDQIKALLTQKYATSILGGSSKDEALGEVMAYAKEGNVSWMLASITQELINIKTHSDALDALSNKFKTLTQSGTNAEEAIRNVFSVDVLLQLPVNKIDEFERGIKDAGYSMESYIEALRNGDERDKAFVKNLEEMSKELGVSLPAAIRIFIAELNNIDLTGLDFRGMSDMEVQITITNLGEYQDNLDSAKDKVDDYFNKTQEGSKKTKAVDIDAAKEASQERIDAAREASEKEIEAMQDAAEERQKAMQEEMDAVRERYDKEIEAIQDTEDKRKEAFDREQELLQRAKDRRASEIDYARAMDEGRYYDAAAIQNEMQNQEKQWSIEDEEAAKEKKAQAQIDALTEERDSRLEQMQKAYDKQVELDNQALEAKREHDQKMLDEMQKAEDKRLKQVEKTNAAINKSNDQSAKHAKKAADEIIEAAKRGPAAMQRVLEKYKISMDQAMALLAERAGMSGAEAAKLLGGSLKSADWKALATAIEAELNGDRNAEQLYDKFWNSIENPPGAVQNRIDKEYGSIFEYASGSAQIGTRIDNNRQRSRGFSYGGYIAGPGSDTSDSIPAQLSNGEYVIRARTVKKLGKSRLDQLNNTGAMNFAEGGLAGSVVRSATWDYIDSKIQERIELMKAIKEATGDVDMSNLPTGDWGPPTPGLKWTTYANHGFARDYQPSPVKMGHPVFAVGPGKVAGMNDGVSDNGDHSAGSPSNWVLVWHKKNGKRYSTYYQHLMKGSVRVKTGDAVDHQTMVGQIGNSGHSTGPHLHFEVREGWNPRYTGPWSADIQDIWKLALGGLIGQEGNPTPDGDPSLSNKIGIVSGYTNTQLKEYIAIMASLAKATGKKTEDIKKDGSIDVAGAPKNKNSPEYAKWFAQQLMKSKYGWGRAQFAALENLWNKESGWNYKAYNASSGATGIPQSLPGNKMAKFGSDWKTNPETQIKWGLDYIRGRYGNPMGAWTHSKKYNWYADGGMVIPALRKGAIINYDNTLANLHRGESVLTAPLTKQFKDGAKVASSGDVTYNVTVNFDRATIDKDDAESIIFGALDKHTARIGRRRGM